jgi:hypothetical protein
MDLLITVAGLFVALYAVAPRDRQLDLKLRVGGISAGRNESREMPEREPRGASCPLRCITSDKCLRLRPCAIARVYVVRTCWTS